MVRLAPNKYSFNNPADARIIYSIGSRFPKSTFYQAAGAIHRPNFFNVQDAHEHAKRKKQIAGLYSNTTVLHYEPAVDRMNRVLDEKLQEATATSEMVDLPKWLQWYAMDVIGEVTVGCVHVVFRPTD